MNRHAGFDDLRCWCLKRRSATPTTRPVPNFPIVIVFPLAAFHFHDEVRGKDTPRAEKRASD